MRKSSSISICLEPADIFVNQILAPPNWIWEDQLAEGCVTLLVAPPKAGKSLFVRNLMANISKGEDFLGKKTIKGPIAYLALEEHPSFLKQSIIEAGLDKSFVHIHYGSISGDQDDLIDYLKNYVIENQIKLVVIDPLSKFCSLHDFNDYGQVYKALSKLTDFARNTNTHILLVHHSNKGGSDSPNQIMGSNGFFGVSDGAFFITRSGMNQGTIKGNLRYGTGIENCHFTYNEKGKLVFQGSFNEVKLKDLKSKVLDAIKENKTATIQQLLESLRIKRESLLSVLADLAEIGLIVKTGSGTKSSPFLYSVPNLEILEREQQNEAIP